MKKLPESIQILGNHIKVIEVDGLVDLGGRFGDWCSKSNTIRVQSLRKGFPDDVVFASYFHEVIHAVLDLTGHAKMSEDEEFVERLGQALYQAEKTRKY